MSVLLVPVAFTSCESDAVPPAPLAENIYAPMGEILPTASDEQRETFERGQEVALRRFTVEEGLGPLSNVTFCGSCHERPVLGGSAPRYRNFLIQGNELGDGTFVPAHHGGVVTAYGYQGSDPRPSVEADSNVFAHRNAIPFFGVGLIAELPEKAILRNEDPDDADGDGISGRANYDRGFVGRFGRKSQTVSIEGFIRGPLNNHLGITSDPLTDEDKAKLPVPSDGGPSPGDGASHVPRQASAPEEPLTDMDDVPDPELLSTELFDLVSFAMLLAVPEPAEPNEQTERGRALMDELECTGCHVSQLDGPRGGLPLYSDLLLHDMGEELADGITQGLATGSEFRTQPLWGVAPVGPYLHDGRADSLQEAIELHGGEAETARDAYLDLSASEQEDVLAFLRSLGGAELASDGLLPPDAPIPAEGEPGAPLPGTDLDRWRQARAAYDRDVTLAAGLGPLFNGDSCRACHFDPVIGGAGPLDVNAMRHGTQEGSTFTAPEYGTILHKLSIPGVPRREHDPSAHNVLEPRQTPSTLGLGLVDGIAEADILANEDPMDMDGDGITGMAQVLPDGRVGRLGWKAQVPSLREFVRDGLSAELGQTVPDEPGFTFGALTDEDASPDPDASSERIDDIFFFMARLAPPLPKADVPGGPELFETLRCSACHIPELPGADGPVPLFSDLLLHQVADDGVLGIADGLADPVMFRTPPLWGLSDTAPYMHDGSAATVEDAILAHRGEAAAIVVGFEALSADDRALLLEFLESL